MPLAPARAAPADLLLVNARVWTLDPARPTAEAVAIRAGRILAVGSTADLRALRGPRTEIVDAAGGVVVPAFHDAHLHLLSWARQASRVDCRGLTSIAAIQAALRARAATLPPGAWVRAIGYDDVILRDGRHPDRHDLDAAVPHHPARLQHRGLHLDILNTHALGEVGLARPRTGGRGGAPPRPPPILGGVTGGAPASSLAPRFGGEGGGEGAPHGAPGGGEGAPPSRPGQVEGAAIERDPTTGLPTGRLYAAAELLHARLPRAAEAAVAEDVRRASAFLLAHGCTSVQDASATNGPAEWALFRRLAATGALGVRLFMLPGAREWETVVEVAREEGAPGVALGPVKFLIDEATTDPAALRAAVARVRAAGRAVALHAVSEAELVLAIDALRQARAVSGGAGDAGAGARQGAGRGRGPDRIEHGAVIPDALLDDLRGLGVTVVGQPALVWERGDVYRAAYPAELHGWLYRARSLVRAGVGYAIGSDAPVTAPCPGLARFAAVTRQTHGGARLGPAEALGLREALAACTLAPARAVGAESRLGSLRPGALADLAILDPDGLDPPSLAAASRPVQLTIRDGRVVWRRSDRPAGRS